MINFYDTSALLSLDEVPDGFYTSSIVINELENIKTAKNKTEDVRYSARKLSRWLSQNQDKYTVVICKNQHLEILEQLGLPGTNDNLIVACASTVGDSDDVVFYTNDVVLSLVAEQVFGLQTVIPNNIVEEEYSGFRRRIFTDDELAALYDKKREEPFIPDDVRDMNVNEYLIIQSQDGEDVDVRRWTGDALAALYNKPMQSVEFGSKIKPKDCYQRMVVDSIMTNDITAISGQAGSGKTLLALVAAMSLIYTKKYERLVILFNPTSTRGAAQLGYYAGSMIEKAMQTSIGNILTTKFGDKYIIDNAVQNERIKLISMADQRGFEVGENEILFITEAQNTSADLLKLCLSRVAEGAKVIIEGDYKAQVDNALFEGSANGLRRAIEVMRGNDIFGYVELQNVWRSKLCELVQKM